MWQGVSLIDTVIQNTTPRMMAVLDTINTFCWLCYPCWRSPSACGKRIEKGLKLKTTLENTIFSCRVSRPRMISESINHFNLPSRHFCQAIIARNCKRNWVCSCSVYKQSEHRESCYFFIYLKYPYGLLVLCA